MKRQIKHCNDCKYFFTENDLSYGEHICLNPILGDPDGYTVPLSDSNLLNDLWTIPNWCPLNKQLSPGVI